MVMAMQAEAIIQSVGSRARRQSRLYIQNSTMKVWIMTSRISIPTKEKQSQILSMSSLIRLISSPVPVSSKKSALSDWMWSNSRVRISAMILDPVTSKVNSLVYWKIHLPTPTRSMPSRSGRSRSMLPPTMTSSTICLVSCGESISRDTLMIMEAMAKK